MTRILTDKFHSSRMSSFEDTTVIAASYLSAAVHVCIVNVREYILVSSPWKPKYASKSVEPATSFSFQMSLGQSPLLTRGNFALLYGGENIVSKLSLLSPGDLNTVFGEPCYFWSGFSNAMVLINMLCNTYVNVTYHCPGEYKMSIVPSIRRQWCLHTPYHLHALPGLPQDGGEVQVIHNLHKDQVLW